MTIVHILNNVCIKYINEFWCTSTEYTCMNTVQYKKVFKNIALAAGDTGNYSKKSRYIFGERHQFAKSL